jgi:hypothetical protein
LRQLLDRLLWRVVKDLAQSAIARCNLFAQCKGASFAFALVFKVVGRSAFARRTANKALQSVAGLRKSGRDRCLSVN